MQWSDFFLFSWLVSEDENEQLRRENEELRQELHRRSQQEWEEEYYDDSFDEDQYYDGQEGE